MPKPTHNATKAALLNRAREILQSGKSLGEAALAIGVGKGTLWKWIDAESRAASADIEARAKIGRPRKFALTDNEAKELRAAALKFASFSFAIESFTHNKACGAATRELIHEEMDRAAREQRRPRWPETLRAAILPREEEEALLRGSKHFESVSHSPRKGMFYTDQDGREIPIRALDVWSMDDYSANQPYLLTGEEERGTLCRQVLACMDLYSAAWLSVEMIGRERDAYRAEDIVRFILRTIDAQGTMPVALMLERGRWDSAAVHGVRLDDLGGAFTGRTWGALDDLFHIEHGYSSRHKASLESSFALLQTALAHSGRDMGRVRGEFEATTKLMTAHLDRVRRAGERGDDGAIAESAVRMLRAGFLTQDEARAAHWSAMQVLNARSRERSAAEFEGKAHVPNDLLARDRGAARPLPAGERWRFLPVKRIATVRGGFIESQVKHYGAPFRFEVNGVSELYLSNGHRVLIAFDPALPELGCHVANAEPVCREGWRVGEFVMTAPVSHDVPQFRLLKRGDHERTGRSRANAAARTAFASVNPHKHGMTHTQAHSGAGRVVIVRSGGAEGGETLNPKPTARGVVRAGLGGGDGVHEAQGSRHKGVDVEEIAAARRRSLEAMGL